MFYNEKRMSGIVVKVLSLLLIAVICFSTVSCSKVEYVDGVIAGEHYGFSDGAFVYYMIMCAGTITEEEMEEHGYDENLELDEMIYEGETTWYDMLVNRATDKLVSLLIYCEEAARAGIDIDDTDRANIESTLSEYRIAGVTAGNMTLDQYLEYLYNYKITEADLQNILECETLASKYSEYLNDSFEGSVTEEEINAELASMSESDDTTLTRRLGHILFNNENYDYNEDTMKKKADEVLADLMSETLTPERFENVAKENSNDKTIFYENVAKGDMISLIDEWIYADGRKIGDCEIVESDYGLHIFYYAEDGEPLSIAQARNAVIEKKFTDWYENAQDTVHVKVKNNVIKKIEFGS